MYLNIIGISNILFEIFKTRLYIPNIHIRILYYTKVVYTLMRPILQYSYIQ